MEFHVHLNMLFWLQSGKVDCWKFNQGFEKSDLKGFYSEKNRPGASFKSSRVSSKINALSCPAPGQVCAFPLSHRALLLLLCIYVSYVGLLYRKPLVI